MSFFKFMRMRMVLWNKAVLFHHFKVFVQVIFDVFSSFFRQEGILCKFPARTRHREGQWRYQGTVSRSVLVSARFRTSIAELVWGNTAILYLSPVMPGVVSDMVLPLFYRYLLLLSMTVIYDCYLWQLPGRYPKALWRAVSMSGKQRLPNFSHFSPCIHGVHHFLIKP